MSEIKNYSVVIFQESYAIRSDEPQDLIMYAATQVDTLMSEVAHQTECSDIKKIAVLVALRLANAAKKLELELEKERLKEEELSIIIDNALGKVSLFLHQESSKAL